MESAHPALAVIGGGNMGRAIVSGAIAARALNPARVIIAELDPEKHPPFAALGVATTTSAASAGAWLRKRDHTQPGQVLLAVKPQMLAAAAADVFPACGSDSRVIISILAGTTSARIADAATRLGVRSPRVVRAMPNLPAAIGKGATAVCLSPGTSEADAALALALFRGIGPVVQRIDETLMDAFTAVAGSGPAYLFYLAQAMMQGARTVGFDDAAARNIVAQTLAGAAAMLAASNDPPEILRAAVTSKGGTTAAATTVLENRSVANAISDAILAARDRGRELGAM
jgi:pyrroline-5-carboxylate reductase